MWSREGGGERGRWCEMRSGRKAVELLVGGERPLRFETMNLQEI